MLKKVFAFIILAVLCAGLMGCQNQTDLKEVQTVYSDIYSDYLEVKRLIYGGNLEISGESADESGFTYFILDEPNYQEVSDIELLLQSVFSEKYISENLGWVLGGDVPLFKEISGKLCIAMKDAVGGNLSERVAAVIEKEEELIIFEIESQDDKFEVTLVKYNERWVIDDIQTADNATAAETTGAD